MVNGVHLHYVEAGSGPLVVLLHGFPEFWYSWRRQIPALAAAGFHVLAPDLRGYNLSDKPAGIASYQLEILAEDVQKLIDHAGAERAVIVGHDWGGVIAYHLAIRRPQTVEKLIVLNAPHPGAFRRELRTLDQLLKSWYIFFFQVPWLPERWLRAGGYPWLKRILRRDPVQPEAFSPADIAEYQRALARLGALTAALNYYRAALRWPAYRRQEAIPRIQAPTLLIWGEKDPHLSLRLTQGLEPWLPQLRIERIGDAGHWVQNEVPVLVNRLMIDFLSGA